MAIKISGSTIIDDSRVIVNADKIGIGTLGPSRDLEIYSDVALVSDFPSAGIAVSATTSLTSNTPKAFQVFNNSSTTQVAISYTGRIDANEYFGTFKGTIDAGVAVGSADQLKVTHSNTNATFTLPFVDDSAANNSYQSFLIDSNASTSLLFNPSTGHLQINGTGKGLLTLRTTDNTSDRGIAFQNSGNNYTASIYAEDIGNSSVDLVFLVDDTNETSLSSLDERMRITNDGKLLIGVNASSQADANLQVFRPTGTTSRIQIGNVATSASGVAGIDFCPSNKVMGSRIECLATEDFSSSANRTADLVFITRKDGTFSEKLRITSDGKVGIGTTIPQTKFEVSSSTGTRIRARHTNVGGARDAGFDIWSDDSGTFAARASLVHSGSGGKTTLYAQNKFNIHSDQTDSSLFIARDGKVGIGSQSPGRPLTITNTDPRIRLQDSNSGGHSEIYTDNDNHLYLTADSSASVGGSRIVFQTDGANERARITNTGELKIANGGKIIIDTNPAATYGISEALRIDDTGGTSDRALQIFEYHHNGGRWHSINYNLNVTTTGSAYTYTQGNYEGSSMLQFGAGELRFYTNASVTSGGTDSITPSERLRIDTDGHVGINESNPQYLLDVSDVTDPVIRLKSTGTGNSDDTVMRYQIGGTTASNYLYFGDSGDTNAGMIRYRHSDDSLRITVNASEKLLINSDGDVLPSNNGTQDLGSSGKRWNILYAEDIDITGNISLSGDINADDLYVAGIATFADDVQVADQIRHLGDLDTMIEFEDNRINFDTGGSQRVLIDSDGDVGINTSSITAGKLEVNMGDVSNSSTDYFGENFAINIRANRGDAANDEGNGIVFSQRWWSNSTDIVRTGAILGYKSSGSGNFGGGLLFKTQKGGASPLVERLRIDEDGQTTIKSTTNQTLILNNTNTNGQSSIQFQSAGTSRFIVGSNKDSDGNPDFFIFDDTNDKHRFNIKGDGNVGIGTDNPSGLIHAQNNSVTDTKIIIESTGTNSYPALRVKNDARSYDFGIDGATDALRIYDVTGTGERLRITSSGQTIVKGVDDQDNFIVDAAQTQFVIHQDSTDGEVSLRAQDGSGNNYAKYMTFFTEGGSGPTEKLRITSEGFIGIGTNLPKTGLSIKTLGDYSMSDGNTYYMPVGKWASAWNHGNDIAANTDYWVGFIGGYTISTSSVNISLAPNRANLSQQQGMYIAGEATGTSTSDFAVGKIIGGSALGQGTSGNNRATKSELFRITSGGALQIGSSLLTTYNTFNGPGRLNIQNNSADGTVDFSQGIVFTDNVNNQGTWTHAGIVATGSSGYRGNLVFGTDDDGTKNNSASNISERMRITSGGSVNIGGSYSQTTRKLYVNGDAEVNGTLYATISGSINPTGNVTITGNLQVNGNTTLGNATSDTVTINATPTIINDNGLYVKSATSAATDGAQIRFSDLSNGTQKGFIRYKHPDGSIAPGSNDGFIIGGTENLTIVRVEGRALVDKEVGIGTDTPEHQLDIFKFTNTNNSNTGTTLLRLNNHVGSSAANGDILGLNGQRSYIDFRFVDTNVNFIPQVRIGAQVGETSGSDSGIPNEGSGSFVVYTAKGSGNAGAGTLSEKFRVDPDGKVGIGSAIPSEKLDVTGNIKVDDGPILESSNNQSLKVTTPYGYVEAGPKNSSYSHFNTDRGRFYFNKKIILDEGILSAYDAHDLLLTTGSNPTTSNTGIFIKNSTHLIGIGNNDPTDLLDVKKSTATAYDPTDDGAQRGDSASITIRNDNGTTNSFSQLVFDTGGSNQSIARIVAIRSGSASNHLAFVTEHSNTKAERLRIKSDGNVGVGTDITSAGGAYGKMSVVIPSQSGGAALQVMNSAVGSADGSLTNIVLRSVNNNAANWAHAQYRASSHDFMHEATSILKVESGGVTVTGTLSADSFNGNITGAADQIKTIQRTTNANHFLTFVDSNNTSSTAENLYTQTRLKYNPSTNILRARNFFADADGGTNNNSQQIVAGDGSGSVAMTINDGYGNCNLAFNHRNGVPDSNGSSGRIWTTVDSTTATMYFELADNSTANSAKALTDVLYLQTNRVTPYVNVIPNSDGTLNLGANGTRWATTYTDDLEVTDNANIGGDLTVGGVLTYEDVTNVDAVGIITARAGIDVTGGKIDIQTGLLELSKVGGNNIIEMGKGQTGNHYAYIDMVGDATYTDYGLRILRDNSGANAQSQITHRGTGNFLISAAEAAAIKIRTNTGTTPKGLMIAGNGKVGVNNDSPQQALHVDGFIYLGPNNTNTHVHGGASVTYSADTDIYFVCDSNDTSGAAPAGEFIWGGGSNTNTDSNRDFTAAEFGNSGKPRNQYMILDENSLRPASNNGLDLGSSSNRFNNIYATSIVGTISAPGNNTEILFNDGGNVVGADSGLTFDKNSHVLTVSSQTTGDCTLRIAADSDNNDEAANPRLVFTQDGTIDVSSIGMNFDNTTGNGNNQLYIANSVSGGGIVFLTGGTNGYTNANEALRIDTNGQIGIGTDFLTNNMTSPLEIRRLNGSSVLQLTRNNDATSGDLGSVRFGNENYTELARVAGIQDGATSHGALTFKTASSGSSSVRMYLDRNGNLGLNATPVKSGTLYTTVEHFLCIGDTDTGIAQDGDGQLEIWANNQEIVNFNTTQITPTKSIIPSSNGSLNLGSSSKRWGTIYATTIDGTITGTITNAQSADKIKTQSRSTNAAHYVTFVDSNNGSATSENLYTDNALLYNPSTNILDASRFTAGRSSGSVSMTINDGYGNANLCFNHEAGVPDTNGSSGRIECGVDGTTAQMMFELWDNVTSGSATGGSSTNIVLRLLSNNVQVYEDIIPNSDSTRDIGTNTNRFKHIYCDNLTAGTITGGTGLTDVAVSYTGRTSPCSLPITVTGSTTKTINIPSSSNAFGAKYVQTTQPTGNSICDGDVWYDTSGTQGTGALSITNSTESNYRNIVFADSSSATTLKVNDNGRIQVRPSDGALRVEGDITAFYSSDCRLKKNVAPIENALDKVNSISGYTFEWNDMTNHEGEEVGVIAQEIEKLGLPNIVTARKDGFYAVRYEKLVPLLIEAIKALKGEIDEIKHTK